LTYERSPLLSYWMEDKFLAIALCGAESVRPILVADLRYACSNFSAKVRPYRSNHSVIRMTEVPMRQFSCVQTTHIREIAFLHVSVRNPISLVTFPCTYSSAYDRVAKATQAGSSEKPVNVGGAHMTYGSILPLRDARYESV
jgi:hypothetical protein